VVKQRLDPTQAPNQLWRNILEVNMIEKKYNLPVVTLQVSAHCIWARSPWPAVLGNYSEKVSSVKGLIYLPQTSQMNFFLSAQFLEASQVFSVEFLSSRETQSPLAEGSPIPHFVSPSTNAVSLAAQMKFFNGPIFTPEVQNSPTKSR